MERRSELIIHIIILYNYHNLPPRRFNKSAIDIVVAEKYSVVCLLVSIVFNETITLNRALYQSKPKLNNCLLHFLILINLFHTVRNITKSKRLAGWRSPVP